MKVVGKRSSMHVTKINPIYHIELTRTAANIVFFKISSDVVMFEQALEVHRCTPYVNKSCLPAGLLQSNSDCTVSQQARACRAANSQGNGLIF